MKSSTCLLVLLLLSGSQGCRVMAYPFARAFGAPSEGELKACRQAFEHMKAQRSSARVLVFPAIEPVRGGELGSGEATERAAARLRAGGFSAARAAQVRPTVAPTPLGANQLRFAWDRAHAYAAWIRTTQPEGDFHLFLEVLVAPSGGIIGVQCHVLDGSGQVAYERLMNSHHFGSAPPKTPEDACAWILRTFLRDLDRPAESVFPPYGVG